MMKSIFFVAAATVVFMSSCNVDYKKTRSGVVYKIFHKGRSSDSLIKSNDIMKFNVTEKLNDSLLGSSYGKIPQYYQVTPLTTPVYSPVEVFPLMRKGDSAVVVLSMDSLIKSGVAQQQFPFAKKGDKLTLTYSILEVFHNDSAARADISIERAKDEPRQQKEMAENRKKMQEEMAKEDSLRKIQAEKDEIEWRKSGEIDREIKAMESYLASKKIKAQKTGKGTFVDIKDPGNGPAAEVGKLVTVKYNGRRLENDSSFQASSYSFVLGKRAVIEGWDEGLLLFKKGGKGTLYIPGFLAYGKTPPPGSPFKSFDPLIFEVEIVDVKDAQ